MPSYLLKVTKFLGKISRFEFLVMAEKNIFAYKHSLSLIFQILIYFFVKIWIKCFFSEKHFSFLSLVV